MYKHDIVWKRCPFCDYEPRLVEAEGIFPRIECTSIACYVNPFVTADTIKYLAKKWNTRYNT